MQSGHIYTYLYLSGHRWTQVYISGFEISGGGIFVLLISKAFIYKQLKRLNDGFTIYRCTTEGYEKECGRQ